MTEKYYTPTTEEFHIGFEFEAKESFMDGTVKTKEEYDKSKWEKKIVQVGDLPYIERAINGKNASKGICGIRVKHLDAEDIISASGAVLIKEDDTEFTLRIQTSPHLFYEIKLDTESQIVIIEKWSQREMVGRVTGNMNCYTLFHGTIKNKSVFKQILSLVL